MENQEYKVITIQSPSKITRSINHALASLFSKYDRKDIYHLVNESSLDIYLNSLDLGRFVKDTQQILLEQTDKETENLTNFLKEIIDKIQAIGSYGIKSGKRIYVNYAQERKVKNRKEKEGKRLTKKADVTSDRINNLPEKYYNQIICGDSMDILKKLPENCIDLIFTSPPYNFGLEYNATQDAHDWNKYFENLFSIFDEAIRVLKYGGRFIVNIQPLFSDYIPSHHIISNYFLSRNMLWKGEILWEKNNYNCKYTSWGSWKSPSSPYLKYTWEFIEIFAKGSLKKAGSSENADITADEFKKWVVAKWSIAPERRMKQLGHPAMFPEELAARAIKLFSFKNDIVLDPFNGVGTTTLVAKNLGRNYLGIDISKEYCQKANKRIKEMLI